MPAELLLVINHAKRDGQTPLKPEDPLSSVETCNVCHLTATPSATRPYEDVVCQQRRQQLVRLKIVEVSEIFAYVKTIFDASRRKIAFSSSEIPCRGWKAYDFAQLRSSQARVR
jgi:hypothetical protein